MTDTVTLLKITTQATETTVRESLATAYRILAYLKMDDATYTHLSARVPGEEALLISPFGSLFTEVTAENLVKVSFDGEVLTQGADINKTGYVIHGNVYQARPDIQFIFHLHTTASVAVSAMKAGLLPVSQFALHLYNRMSYFEYRSLELSFDKGTSLVGALGQNNVMLLRNHGSLTCGKTIHETMFYTYHLEEACKVQCALQGVDESQLVIPPADVCEQANHELLTFEQDLGLRDWAAWCRMVG